MFRFAEPQYLYLLILIPALAFLQLYLSNKRKKDITRFGDPVLLDKLMPHVSYSRPIIKHYLLLLGLAMLIVAMAQPQFGSKLETVKRKGIELMVALDVSNSMNANDIEPSRLERAKQAIAQLVDKLSNDKIGIVVFAGQAYTQLPITTDYPSAKMFLRGITTDILDVQGTAIGAAIQSSARAFTATENINRAIIIISDGENHEDNAIEAAKLAYENGIRIYTVGMGLPQGGPIPLSPGSQTDFLKDKDGNVVITKMNDQMMQDIALAGGGNYIPANNIRNGMNQLVEELSRLEKSEIESKIYTDYDDQFPYIVLIALLLMIADFCILERKNKFFENIRLFIPKRLTLSK
ncbi:Ca-activated chloride channel family protein [Breznakibacter xylanolyticus]|uniref:Ca-activated chloride channel family protein n=1 Tax=Breznakibacter xylanolyticus TaxID=990 RepID=A0A2W7NT45_9BACT|nr:VWA domain-containing protein [Breznakibacter xylanolyticus]MBN2743228.1 VWA domain-containing protein [Marinilabiliaceae bacterium]PZX14412.1 Ca-activated chloride channel family protein [Breznakibacter xylanolyticus]